MLSKEESVVLFHIYDCSDSVGIPIDVAIFWLHVDMVWSITFDYDSAYSDGELLKNKGRHQWKKQNILKAWHFKYKRHGMGNMEFASHSESVTDKEKSLSSCRHIHFLICSP
ncbi:hypothetical protein Bca101_068627 [Brassica carinata]